MAANDNTKYFWVKLFTRFFDKHEIQILWGKNRDFVLLYIRLLLESVPNHGLLKYNKEISYSAEDLAILFHMPEDIVSSGLKELEKKQLIFIDEDKTIFVPAAPNMCGFDTGLAIRLKEQRGFKKGSNEPISGSNEPAMNLGSGSNDPRVQSTEYRVQSTKKRNNIKVISPLPPVDDEDGIRSKGSDEFKHVSRDDIKTYFARMRQNGGKNLTDAIEEDFWQYLVMADFKKGDCSPITKANVHSTFNVWMSTRRKAENEIREKKETEAKKAAEVESEAERKRKRAELLRANTLKYEIDE